MPTRPKRTEYAVAVERSGRAVADGAAPLELDRAWTPEHLLLFALARCSVWSLEYHARRLSVRVSAAAEASGAVSPREDGRWGLVDLECRIDCELEPPPAPEPLRALIRSAERGCFVGASLEPKPRYRWSVGGAEVS